MSQHNEPVYTQNLETKASYSNSWVTGSNAFSWLLHSRYVVN